MPRVKLGISSQVLKLNMWLLCLNRDKSTRKKISTKVSCVLLRGRISVRAEMWRKGSTSKHEDVTGCDQNALGGTSLMCV